MPDTYDHKPTADELLHDLARVATANNGALLVAAPGTPEGPIERVVGAVDEYMASPDWDESQPPTPDYHEMLMHAEHGRWLELCEFLREGYEIDVNEKDHNMLVKLIEMWGEDVSRLRAAQTSAIRESAFKRRHDALEEVRMGGSGDAG
jgi:hypothetical protein